MTARDPDRGRCIELVVQCRHAVQQHDLSFFRVNDLNADAEVFIVVSARDFPPDVPWLLRPAVARPLIERKPFVPFRSSPPQGREDAK